MSVNIVATVLSRDKRGLIQMNAVNMDWWLYFSFREAVEGREEDNKTVIFIKLIPSC